MSKRAEEAAKEIYKDGIELVGRRDKNNNLVIHPETMVGILRNAAERGYEQAEKDLADAAAFSSGPDGFYYGKGYQQGKKDAEKNLGWHSVEESLPEMDEEVIVLTDELGTAPIYKISFGHIVDTERCIDFNGWNVPDVKFWMPCPKIPNND